MAALREGNIGVSRSKPGGAALLALVVWASAGVVRAAPTTSPSASAAPSAAPMTRGAALSLLAAAEREATDKLGLGPRQRRLRLRPPGEERNCDVLRRVCVHAAPGVSEAAARRALAEASSALAGYEALKLRRPPDDLGAGGDPSFDVYLDPVEGEGRAYVDVGTTDSMMDVGTTFVGIAPSETPGCAFGARVATRVAEAALLGLDASIDPGALEMSARYLATLVAPCDPVEIGEVDAFQRAPDRCLVSDGDRAQAGSFLFPQFLEQRYSAAGPGSLTTSLVAISWQKAQPGKGAWPDEPDFFDALRTTLKARDIDLGEVMLDFAIERAFMGSRSDEAHLYDVARFGDLGRPRLEWVVAFDKLPKRLLPSRPVDALGATYVWVDVSNAPANASLSFEADWERPFLFRWSLVKVKKDGSEENRIKVAPVFGEYEASHVVGHLEDLAGILIVGENDAEWSKSQPFDPGEPRLLPKNYGITLRAGTPE